MYRESVVNSEFLHEAEELNKIGKHNIGVFAKDASSKYVYCNDAVAGLAGFDSACQMLEKTDFQCKWKEQAYKLVHDDERVVYTSNVERIHDVLDVSQNFQYKGKIKITCVKRKTRIGPNNEAGVFGYFNIDFQPHEMLSDTKFLVLVYKALGYSDSLIASHFMCSPRTVNEHTEWLKDFFNVKSLSELVSMCLHDKVLQLPHSTVSRLESMVNNKKLNYHKRMGARRILGLL